MPASSSTTSTRCCRAALGWVADRGFASAENRRYLTRAGGHYILGERLRSGSAEAAAALARPGRYRQVADNLQVKEVRLRPRTDEHDLQVRVRAARRFLEEGHKVKVEVRFRGREATHPEVARAQIASIAAGVADIAMVERQPSLEGRTMFAILARGRAPQT